MQLETNTNILIRYNNNNNNNNTFIIVKQVYIEKQNIYSRQKHELKIILFQINSMIENNHILQT